VPLRPGWQEAACGTVSVYDRNRKRLGTVYLGEMPKKDQIHMTRRLTHVITGTLRGAGEESPRLRYVTDAGSLPQSYFRKVLSKMKHPLTRVKLQCSWGVDFYHACEYVTKLAGSIFGVGSGEAHQWAEDQRRTLRDDDQGVSRVLTRAAQQKRRQSLQGSEDDYNTSTGYLRKYKPYMDYAERRRLGDPIGSGITEAGCKVIFNQRFKQSGMRWNRLSAQSIVHLRTACRSGIWGRIWRRLMSGNRELPPINQAKPENTLAAA
jgi:hypothetical protein